MRVVRRGQKKRLPSFMKILFALFLMVGTSFCLAWVWHTTQEAAMAGDLADLGSSSASQTPALVQTEESAESTSAIEPEPAPEPDGEEGEGEEPEEPQRPVYPGAVPASARVDNSYFDDAIFIGDSISTGIPLYHIADNAAVVAMTGINTVNALTKQCIEVGEDDRVTLLEAAKAHGERAKVYIMLGSNGLGYDLDPFISGYEEFLDAVKVQYPNAVIYVQSMTPVTDYAEEQYPSATNETIQEYNEAIAELALKKGLYFLDVASALMDENGELPEDASPVDGLHFTPEYYAKWFDYLKTHTVEVRTNR